MTEDTREQYRQQAVQEVEELIKQGVRRIPVNHPVMITVFRCLLSPVTIRRNRRKHPRCPECDSVVRHGWEFCAYCGEHLFEDE